MFTGIIETMGRVQKIEKEGNNIHYFLSSSITHELKIDQSVSHNGVCLTVVGIQDDVYQVTAIQETLQKTNLKTLEVNDSMNLERCTAANGRFDGHIVQGHVDTTAVCTSIEDQQGSFVYTFSYASHPQFMTVEKGSIAVNGISLTVINSHESQFSVAIIPYTLENTNLKEVKINSTVNLEFDIIGKYVAKIMASRV